MHCSRSSTANSWCCACRIRWATTPSGSTAASTTRRKAGRGRACGPPSRPGRRSTWKAARGPGRKSCASSCGRVHSPTELGCYGQRAVLVVADRLFDLFARVHDEGAVLHDRLADRLASEQDEARALVSGLDLYVALG